MGCYENMLAAIRGTVTVDNLGSDGYTPLAYALGYCGLKEVRALLDAGANVNYVHENGKTPIECAAYVNDSDSIQLLIDRGAVIDHCETYPALVIAIRRGNIAVVRTLLENGADVNRVLTHRMTALMHAAIGNKPECARILIQHGALTEDRCTRKFTALHWASIGGHYEVTNALLECGASATALMSDRSTPLMGVVTAYKANCNTVWYDMDLIRLLVEYGIREDRFYLVCKDTRGMGVTAYANGIPGLTELLNEYRSPEINVIREAKEAVRDAVASMGDRDAAAICASYVSVI